VAHIEEARQKAKEVAAQERAREHDQALVELSRETELLMAAAPGFPPSPASGADVAAALEILAPSRKFKFRTSFKKRWGRYPTKVGWQFTSHSERANFRHRDEWLDHYLIVPTDGEMFIRDSFSWNGGFSGRTTPVTSLEGETWRRVLVQVLNWTGTRPSFQASQAARELAAIGAAGNGAGGVIAWNHLQWYDEHSRMESILGAPPAAPW
jgi:hypothetical protein